MQTKILNPTRTGRQYSSVKELIEDEKIKINYMKYKKNTLLTTHFFVFNDGCNSGEQLILTTRFFADGQPIDNSNGIYINQDLTLCSYSNSTSFHLGGAGFTPKLLRQLAYQLDRERKTLVIDKNVL